MTVSTTSISKSTSGNGSATSFPYDYKILEASDLQVIIRSATGAETIKATSTYTVTGVGADSGTIVFNNSNIPASGETVVVTRNVLQTQAIDYIANDPFPAETHEEGLDRATMVIQQVSGDADRSIKISKTNTMTSTEFTVRLLLIEQTKFYLLILLVNLQLLKNLELSKVILLQLLQQLMLLEILLNQQLLLN